MTNGCSYKERITLDSARTREMRKVPTSGYVKVVDSSDASLTITVGVDRESGNAAEFVLKRSGDIKDNGSFDRLYITNSATAGGWVDIICSQSAEDFDVNKGDLGVISSISDAVVTKGGNSLPTQGAPVSVGTTATAFFTADSTITDWIAQNTDTAKTMYCGGPSTTTTNYAFTLLPGEKCSGTCSAPPYAVVSSGTANLGVMTAKKV